MQKLEFIKQLEEKNMEFERFTYTVSHELKSALVTACGFIGLPRKDLVAGDRGAMVEIEDGMPGVYTDQARIREVIKGLVENGIKFTPAACAEGRNRRRGARRSLLCRLRDDGPGVEPRCQSRAFGLFERLDNAIPGNGVGLARVKRIVEIHDGGIRIESRGVGQGSCFCFTLPIQRGS